MTENYLQILIESLEKKQEVLEQIGELDARQAQLLLEEEVDKEEFDRSMNEKQVLIDKLNSLDEGFEKTYELVKDEVQKNKEPYIALLKRLQEQVNLVVEQGVSIQAQEERLKQKLNTMFRREYSGLHQRRMSAKASEGYYQSMQMINTVDPQLMDRRK